MNNAQKYRLLSAEATAYPDTNATHALIRELGSAVTDLLAQVDKLEAAEHARLRDLQYPEYTPESVVDAVFESQEDWYKPGSKPVQPVLVANFMEKIADVAYRATLKHQAGAPERDCE